MFLCFNYEWAYVEPNQPLMTMLAHQSRFTVIQFNAWCRRRRRRRMQIWQLCAELPVSSIHGITQVSFLSRLSFDSTLTIPPILSTSYLSLPDCLLSSSSDPCPLISLSLPVCLPVRYTHHIFISSVFSFSLSHSHSLFLTLFFSHLISLSLLHTLSHNISVCLFNISDRWL